MKLALYSFAGSGLVLAGIIAAWVVGGHTMSLEALAHTSFSAHFQMWAFPLVFVGFAVLAGMWPFHTWAPGGHAAAPTGASMLLAGVVMKLGAYGCLRVAMMLFPRGLDPWGFHLLGLGSWRDVFALLALIGIVYGASVALVQRDFKLVIGYSSVSHMGFVLLGLMTLNQIGLDGAVFQMFSHGVIAGLLFAVVGRMVYDRTHTRDLNELGPMHLARAIPFAAVIFILAAMASIGLPGFSGFIAEFQMLIGVWRSLPSDDRRRRLRHPRRHRLHLARHDQSLLRRRPRTRRRAPAAAHHLARAPRRVPAARHNARRRTLSTHPHRSRSCPA